MERSEQKKLLRQSFLDALYNDLPRSASILHVFNYKLMGLSESASREMQWQLIDTGTLELTVDRKILMTRPTKKVTNVRLHKNSLYTFTALEIRKHMLGNNGYLPEPLYDNLRSDKKHGQSFRRAVWYLIDTGGATIDWQGKLVLLHKEQ
ncbi:MAG: hypothetical protein HQ536_01235 [Parcubacteria group bacterium]|nr:hypothetical protein [Parcubacteria group bacterium]